MKTVLKARPLGIRPAAVAMAMGFAVFISGTGAESLIIRVVSGSRSTLEWISDTIISIGAAGLTYLWLHLRESRNRLLEAEKATIVLAEQMRLAAVIQRNLLPDIPLTSHGLAWAARMIPAGDVGGDFYDFLEPSEDVTLVFMGDISGKGIPAALLHSSLRAFFRLTARETHDPVSIAERVGAALHGQTGGTPYATAIVARFDHKATRLTYVNAGHPAGIVFRDGDPRLLDLGGPPLGLLSDTRYVAGELDLRPGDVGILVTDGITEALEGRAMGVGELLRGERRLLGDAGQVAKVCDFLLAAASEAPGPPGAGDWQDDATAFLFGVAPLA